MTELWSALIGAAGGVVIKSLFDYAAYVRAKRRRVRLTALKCLDRLEKLAPIRAGLMAERGVGFHHEDVPENDPRQKMVNDELWHLGADLDAYLGAVIDASRAARRRDVAVYRRMRPLVSDHDLSVLDDTALLAELRAIARIGPDEPRREGRA